MTNKAVPDIFVDMITNVTYANGVLRVALARAGANNEPDPVATMLLPGTQLTPFLNGLNEAGKNIATQIQERQEEAHNSLNSENSSSANTEEKGSNN
tara:strand:- start:393 stop:683 length:291 start_codon:yes stop_codon:yes gene_type:complete